MGGWYEYMKKTKQPTKHYIVFEIRRDEEAIVGKSETEATVYFSTAIKYTEKVFLTCFLRTKVRQKIAHSKREKASTASIYFTLHVVEIK